MIKDLRETGRIDNQSWREKINTIIRDLRKNQTKEEKAIWEVVRNRNLFGKKFLRQHPIIHEYYKKPYFFITDFYCAEAKLILEIDGRIHDLRKEYDEQRTTILNQKGLKVLRIRNEELHDMSAIVEKINEYLF